MEMIKVCSSAKMEEEEVGDDGELSLELSIGTKSYKKANPLPQKKIILGLNCWDVSRPSHDCPGSKFDLRIEPCPPKQDMQALRRKKRDEKLQLASSSSSSKQGHNGNKGDDDDDDDDDDDEMPPRKREKSQGSRCNNVFPNFGQKEDVINKEEEKEESYWNHRMIDHGSGSTCPSMQYVSFTTGGCGYPYASISSCFGNINGIDKDKRVGFDMANDGLEKEKRVGFEMVASQSFRPYSRDIDGNRKSDCSSGGSSSALSDHHNSSHQGGNSSINITQDNQNAAENSEIKCWDSMGMGEVKVKTKADQSRVNVTSSTNNIQVRRSICNEEPKLGAPLMEPVLSNKKAIFAALLKKESNNINVITNIPAQPKCPQMPCVSTTGNGPNGKTIMGFLYRYTKTEVCIVCVCHGTSFSPAEFVKHAGGVDVEHPLRHITVVRTI